MIKMLLMKESVLNFGRKNNNITLVYLLSNCRQVLNIFLRLTR